MAHVYNCHILSKHYPDQHVKVTVGLPANSVSFHPSPLPLTKAQFHTGALVSPACLGSPQWKDILGHTVGAQNVFAGLTQYLVENFP